MEVLEHLLTESPSISVKDLTNEAVEMFFGATNQKNRNRITLTEDTIIETARKFDTGGGPTNKK